MEATQVILVLLLVFVVLCIWQGVRTVPQGNVWTVERFGAFTRLLQPGLNLTVPFVERVGHRMNVQEIVLDIPEQAVITRDNAAVAVDGILYYRVLDVVKAAYGAQNLVQALTTLCMTNIRSVIGALDLDGALSEREHINARLLETMDGATQPWGVKITRVELRKIEPPADLVRAMNLQMTAERERRATVARAQGEREAEIARAEGRKQSQVLDAEARLLAAEKDAAARERLAAAEAEATRLVAEAASGAGAEALRYFIAQRYVEAFGRLAGNPAGRTLVVPVESVSLAGGIAQALEAMRMDGGRGLPASSLSGPAPARPAGPGSVPGVQPLATDDAHQPGAGLDRCGPAGLLRRSGGAGGYLIWLGTGAVLTGPALLLVGLPVLAQIALFAVLAGMSVLAGRAWERRRAAPDPNAQGADLVGEACRAVLFDGAEGRVRFRDSEWAARSTAGAVPPGAALRIVGVDGNRLLVAPEAPP